MKRILYSDWLLEQASWPMLATEDVFPTRKKFSWPYDNFFQACLVEMTGY